MAAMFWPMLFNNREVVNIILIWLLLVMPVYAATDIYSGRITPGQQLRDWESLYSLNKMFKLRFFSLGISLDRYLGIFVDTDADAVWLANRSNPIKDTSGTLTIDPTDGMLKITYNGGNLVLSTPASTGSNDTVAILQDDGNLVFNEMNSDGSINRTVWQSFDYPTDTLLPGMKLGMNSRTGHKWSLTSWMSRYDPALGSFTLSVDPNGTNQLILWWQENVYWTSGLWHDGNFENSHLNDLSLRKYYNLSFISNQNEKHTTYSVHEDLNNISRTMRLSPFGEIRLFTTEFISLCDLYSKRPRIGCVNFTLPACRKGDYSELNSKLGNMDEPLPAYFNLSYQDCRAKCTQNCSCHVFATPFIGSGCYIWSKEGSFYASSGALSMMIYTFPTGKENKKLKWLIAAIGGGTLLITILGYFILRNLILKAKEKKAEKLILNELVDTATLSRKYRTSGVKIDKKTSQFHLFSIDTIEKATNNFSTTNKLGEGGFGPVYKGELPNGHEIAIKRLSRNSGQGLVEFKNEIQLIAKLQHNNLVRLLGCCIQGQEKILVYEYMPNKSLDFFLFDPSKRNLLKWNNCVSIIEGVAQGLLYLHQHSRLRVIHRDLKASNVLLDQNMHPKISDFGMARIFGTQEFAQWLHVTRVCLKRCSLNED